MALVGHWDLGKAGIRNEPLEDPDIFPYEVGAAWGNLFLDCEIRGSDEEHVLCEASNEIDRELERDEDYQKYAAFTCAGASVTDETYPIHEMGKSCFSEDQETNDDHDCPFFAATGPCVNVCQKDGDMTFCGVNKPPVEGRGTTNVVWVYLPEPDLSSEED